jgi:hypothetical protein
MLAGAVAATPARSLAEAVVRGMISHLALDALPHQDYRAGSLGGAVLAADLAGGAVLAYKLTAGTPRLLAGAFGGVLPDILGVGERCLRVDATSRIHRLAHNNATPRLWRGAANQVTVAVLCALALRERQRLRP